MLNREKSKCSDRNGGQFRKQQTIVKKIKIYNFTYIIEKADYSK